MRTRISQRQTQRKPEPATVVQAALHRAIVLDRLADLALAEGRHGQAEYLARRAEQVREARA